MKPMDKVKASETYKEAKKEYFAKMTDENWKDFCLAKRDCMRLGVRI